MGAQITMSVDEYDEQREHLRRAHAENAKLTDKLNAALQADPEGRIPVLVEAILAALPVVRFGVSNLDPRAVTRWPFEALREFADALEKAPGLGDDKLECAIELRAFAHEIELIEHDRAARGLYDGPDPIDMILLGQIARGEFTRVGALVEAGYVTVELTDEGREVVRESSEVNLQTESNVADATDSA
jgi:hypothetical protein